MKKTIVIFCLPFLFSLFLHSISFSEQVNADRGFPKVGTKFIWEVNWGKNKAELKKGKNKYEFVSQVIEDGTFKGKEVFRIKSTPPKGENINIYDKTTQNRIAKLSNDGRIIHQSRPYEGYYDFPLTVGKKYKVKFFWSDKDWKGEVNYKAKVKSYEKITVPAGSYDTYKIDLKGKWLKIIIWYSPEIKYLVKYYQKHKNGSIMTQELIKYSAPSM